MSFTSPYGQHNYLGEHVNDTSAESFLSSESWPLSDGVLYYNTTLGLYRGYLDGIWTSIQTIKFPSSGSDPVSPTPVAGDRYYNTVLGMWMTYDGTRSKWLSEESAWFQTGRNGNTAPGSYYRGINGKTFEDDIGYPSLFAGTIVGFGYTRADTDAATFEIRADGVAAATVASSAVSGTDTSLDADFTQGQVLNVFNASGGNATSNVQAWVRIKWRAS